MSEETGAAVEAGKVEEQVTKPVDPPAEENNDLGDAGKKALQAEREARKQADKQLKEVMAKLEKFEDAQRSEEERRALELERAQNEAREASERAAKAERKALIATIVAEEGVPASHAHRVVGETEEELRADAKALAESLNGGPRKPAPVPEAGTFQLTDSDVDARNILLGN